MKKIKMSVRFFLNLTAVMLVCAFLFFEVIISFNVFMNILNKKTGEIYQNDLQQVTERVSVKFRVIENLISSIAQKSEQEKFCTRYRNEQNIYIQNQLQRNIGNNLMEKTIGFNINEFDILFEDGSTLFKNYKIIIENFISGYDALESAITKSGRNAVFLASYNISPSADSAHFIFAALLTEGNKPAGILLLLVDNAWIKGLLGTDDGAMLIDRQKRAVLGGFYNAELFTEKNFYKKMNNMNGSFEIHDESQNWQIHYQNMEGIGLTAAVAKNMSQLLKTIQGIRERVLLLTIFGCIVSFALGSLLVGRTTRPIHILLGKVKNLGDNTTKAEERQHNTSNSMRNMVFNFYITTVLIPMLVYTAIFYFEATDKIQYIVKDSLEREVVKTVRDIADYFDVNENASIDIVIERNLQNFLSERTNSSNAVTLDEMAVLDRQIRKNLSLVNNTTCIEIFNRYGNLVYSSDGYETGIKMDQKYFNMTERSHGEAIWNHTDIDLYGIRSICMIRRIYDLGYNQLPFQTIGFLKLSIPESEIRGFYRKFNYDKSDFFVLDEEGLYVSSLVESRIGELSGYSNINSYIGSNNSSVIRDRKVYDIIAAGDKRLPLVFMGVIPRDVILQDNDQIISSSLYMILTICIVLFTLSYMLSLFFSRAFDNMTYKLNRFFKGDFQVDFMSKFYFSEIDQLADTFNNMSLRINDLTKNLFYEHLKAKELEKEKKESEIIALQTQINPHFLYNTFESIKWMMRSNKGSAELMLTQLGELFRLGISSKAQLVMVAEEIRYANIYIDIQRLRYQDKVKIVWEVSDQVLENTMPKFTLQPLIENAYKHAFHSKKGNCMLRICGYYEEGYVVFSIIDNGEGIPAERLKEIVKRLEGDLPGESVGIFNVQKRLRLYYGEKAGLTLISQPRVSTIVRVRIPFEESHNKQNIAQLK